MKARTALVIAIFDGLAFALTIYYASKVGSGNIDAMLGILMFYLILVILALAKLTGWQYVISACIHDERVDREDTKYGDALKKWDVPEKSIDPVEMERRRKAC